MGEADRVKGREIGRTTEMEEGVRDRKRGRVGERDTEIER